MKNGAEIVQNAILHFINYNLFTTFGHDNIFIKNNGSAHLLPFARVH